MCYVFCPISVALPRNINIGLDYWNVPQNHPYSFSDLRLQILHANGTHHNTTAEYSGLESSILHDEMVIFGNPMVVKSPVGTGIRCTAQDGVVIRYLLSDPLPCPFNITRCGVGLSFSMWFRGEKTTFTRYKNYIKMDNVFCVYRPGMSSQLRFRWNTHKEHSWYNSIMIPVNEWVHVVLIRNDSHTISYYNGGFRGARARETSGRSVVMTNEIKIADPRPGNYSVGRLAFWSRRVSPVFVWRLYQEGLPNN